MNKKQQFLLKTVGIAGAKALQRVIDQYPDLIDFICKSAIDSWCNILNKGKLKEPLKSTNIKLLKNSLMTNIGISQSVRNNINENNFKNLAKNIDLLVKSQFISSSIKKQKINKNDKELECKLPKLKTLSKNKKPKEKKRVLNISKSYLSINCSLCHQAYFKNNVFIGCLCLNDVRKAIATKIHSNKIELVLNENELDCDSLITILDIFNDKSNNL